MIKRLIKIWFMIAMYELGKCIGREVYYKLTANDEVEVPKDFDKNSHKHLENIWDVY
ncbi:transcriptional activator RinB [Staphylococcus epidermidis]|uniref:transcriptional activator RinB n=1 Tax=Staphylococcus epidermidis TaxID=1282 RepID=UPI001D0D4244|nr:transcriptional activator RinB [Staphylococcus epidermidis]MCC2070770.1 transcriptional activator RinB [Staphylococcus epidermidis]